MIFPGLTMREMEYKDARSQVRMHAGIRSFLSSRGIDPSKSYGGRHVYKCPVHAGDNSPSFYVYEPEDGYDNFFCFGCKKWGDVVDLRSLIDRISIEDSCSLFCEEKNIYSSSKISEEELLDMDIGNWGKEEDGKRVVKDFGVLCFSMAKLFRNMVKSECIICGDRSEKTMKVYGIMSDFDKMIRAKDYDNAKSNYEKLKLEFKNA
jgi:hypothetical protein